MIRVLAIGLALLASLGASQPISSQPPLFAGARTVDALIESAISDGKIPGAVLVIGHNGQIVYRRAYGQRALVPAREAMTEDTVFDCASLTKVVATTPSLMRLFELGRIHPSDKVTDYLPEFQHGKSDITVRDLMTHYSGLRPDLDLDPAWSGYQIGIQKALAEVSVNPPETKFVYSDINFILLGEIVRRVSGEPLDQFAREQIFQPLGMLDTTFRPSAAVMSRIAPTERLKTGEILRGVVHDPTSRYMGGVAGHAGLFSTANDLSRFCQMMLNKGVNPAADASHPTRLFSANTIELFTSPQSPQGLPAVRGFGWDINSPYSGTRGDLFPVGSSYGHTGFTGTSLWLDPASQTYVILLTNAVHPTASKPITPLRKSIATAAAEAVGYPPKKTKTVRTGLDVWEDDHFQALAGKRVALITNRTGINRSGQRNIDVMLKAGIRITAILTPEHGFASLEDKPNISGGVDSATGIRIWSLFSEKSRRPPPEVLRAVDVVVFDIADVGVRFYTYVTTMAYAMEECAKARKPFVVLDRPDPLTGLHVEGPMLDPENQSFVGYFPIPLRHGMTVGELARMFNAENKIGVDLTVVPVAGWERADWFDVTGLPWVNPSPNIRSLEAALLYPGLGMLEYSENYSVGRGTETPFQIIGAAWIRGRELAQYLNGRQIPGVRAYPTTFRPESNHLAGTTLEGVRFSITNRDAFNAGQFGLEVAAALRKLFPDRIRWEVNRQLIGASAIISELKRGADPQTMEAGEKSGLDQFLKLRQAYLLYP